MDVEGIEEVTEPEVTEPQDKKKEIKQRNHPGPLSRAIYDLFVKSLRRRASRPHESPWPSGPELKAAGFLKPKGGHSRREKFKNWAERLELVLEPESNAQVLGHKRTGKIIVPIEDFENVIRQFHEQGHLDPRKTTNLVILLTLLIFLSSLYRADCCYFYFYTRRSVVRFFHIPSVHFRSISVSFVFLFRVSISWRGWLFFLLVSLTFNDLNSHLRINFLSLLK